MGEGEGGKEGTGRVMHERELEQREDREKGGKRERLDGRWKIALTGGEKKSIKMRTLIENEGPKLTERNKRERKEDGKGKKKILRRKVMMIKIRQEEICL